MTLLLIVYFSVNNQTSDSLIKLKLDLENTGEIRYYHFYFPITFALSGYVVFAGVHIISIYFIYICAELLKKINTRYKIMNKFNKFGRLGLCILLLLGAVLGDSYSQILSGIIDLAFIGTAVYIIFPLIKFKDE